MGKTWSQKVLNLFLDQDGDSKAGRIEKNTNGLSVIESEHIEIYKGNAYKAGYRNVDVSASAQVNILIRVPDTISFLHINHNTFKVTGAPFLVDLYEGTTFSSTGSAVASYNINRTSSNTALARVFVGPGVISAGACLDCDLITGDKSGGGDLEGYNEHYVLKGNEDYTFRATNTLAQAKGLSFRMSWFERNV